MKSVRAFLLLFLSFSSVLPAQDGSSRSDVQKVLGFEDQTGAALSGWNAHPDGSVFADDHVKHAGRWAVRLQRDAQSAAGFSVITRNLPVDFQGGAIELRGFLRLQDVSGYAGLWMREDADGQVLSLESMQSRQVKGSHDWTEYRIALPIDPEAQELHFGVLTSGSGTLWADDLQLYVDGKPIAQAPGKPVPPPLPRVQPTALTQIQVDNLVTLGRVWGFLKYHHPAVTSGHRNWDFDLLRVLPLVLAAPGREQANELILHWVQGLGPVPACKPCVSAPAGDLDLKPDLNWIHDRSALGVPLSRLLEEIYANRTGQQFYVSLAPGVGNPVFVHELPFAQLAYPDFRFQLLALFRWWNIMQYWSPDREVARQNWPEVLARFVPRVALAGDKNAYELALMQLIATANDTHANLWSSLQDRPPVGDCSVPIELRFVENKPVVYRAPANDSGLQLGDVIDKVDGTSISELVARWSSFYADSNQAARLRDIAANLTRGTCGPVSFEITRAAKPVNVEAQRVHSTPPFAAHDQPGDTFRFLSPSVAYLKLSTIKAGDLPGYFSRAKDTGGIIVDIRNYPSAFMPFALGQYFAVKPTPFVSFTFADLANPGAFRFGPGQTIQPGTVHYRGKLVILMDETSQSQAEYTALALRAPPNAVVVGSTTAGADGNVSNIPLPGALATMISGLGVFYPDHRPTQRIGIIPDIVTGPTIEGIAAGRDEVLETARRLVEGDPGSVGGASSGIAPR